MATFTTNPNHAVNFNAFDIDHLRGSHLYLANATLLRTGNAMFDTGDNIEFAGVGFSYSAGALTGGIINSITSHIGGALDFQISGMSMSVASFNAFEAAGNTEGFLAAVFAGADSITGSNAADTLMGFAGKDTMNGLDGDDIIDGGTGADMMTGGKGNDTYVIDNAGDVIVEAGGSTADRVVTTFSVDLNKGGIFIGIEHATFTGKSNVNFTGNSQSNWVFGNSGNNKLIGNQGDDIMSGGSGNDTLDGGTGIDQLYGGYGNDVYFVDSSYDKLSETASDGGDSSGVDLVYSSAEVFVLGNWIENLTLIGAGKGAFGNSLDNILIGNAGDNYLNGKQGADKMTGGAGNDIYEVDHLQDKVTESAGNGNDAVFASISHTLSANVEVLNLTGAALNGTGNSLMNLLSGNDYGNKLDGGAGNDQLRGYGGNDVLIGGAGNDSLFGQAGNDTVDVSAGDDRVYYQSALDGYDVIQGFDGNATGGQDRLTLELYFDELGVDDEERAARVGLVDTGASVDVWIDTDGNGVFNTKIVTIQTMDAISVGADIQVT